MSLARLRIREQEGAAFEINMVPAQRKDFGFAAAGEQQQPDCSRSERRQDLASGFFLREMLRGRLIFIYLPFDANGFGLAQSVTEPRQFAAREIALLALFLEPLHAARRVVSSRHVLCALGPIEQQPQNRNDAICGRLGTLADLAMETDYIGVTHIAGALRAQLRPFMRPASAIRMRLRMASSLKSETSSRLRTASRTSGLRSSRRASSSRARCAANASAVATPSVKAAGFTTSGRSICTIRTSISIKRSSPLSLRPRVLGPIWSSIERA